MTDPTIAELDERIAMIRHNINELIEQAAAYSGAEDENRAADRIAQQLITSSNLVGCSMEEVGRTLEFGRLILDQNCRRWKLPFDGGEAGNSVPRQRVIAGKTVPRSSIGLRRLRNTSG
jgi:hypothetical protein